MAIINLALVGVVTNKKYSSDRNINPYENR